ncbi:1463_t:CDS:2 [Acaulospora colombiana]|uniref:1463_t:CDS:1 n=1 Tax=Acaulospora colombiana TaxID=27376 RepID=A0ACA9KVT6_9GLOM|nr:1463_t:CDS:2 [Acaulospora colombiana]
MALFTYVDVPVIIILLVIAYVSYYYYEYFTRESPLPGPLPLPLIGNAFTVAGDIAIWPSKLQLKYGDMFEVYMGPRRKVWLCNEKLAEKIFNSTTNSNFHNRINEDCDLKEIGLVNTGLAFNIDYENWTYVRKFYSKAIFSPAFMKQAMISTQNIFQKMESYWAEFDEDTVLDFSLWIRNSITDTVFLLTTSRSLHALTNYYNEISPKKDTNISDSTLKESEYFLKCTSALLNAVMWFFMVPKFFRDFPGIRLYTNKLKEQVKWLKNFVNEIVKERREEIARTPEDEELTRDLLTMFLTVNTSRDITKGIADDINDRIMTDEEITHNFIEILGAGINTVSDLMCYLVYLISKQPEVKQRLIKEFDEVLGKGSNFQLTYEGVNKLLYCDAVIKEASRVSSVAPFIVKRNEKPDEVGGYTFPEYTEFFINYVAIRKHKSKWTDPELFNPNRFFDKSHPDYENDPHTFGDGLRKCPGRNLARLNLKVILVMLFKKYDVELMDSESPLKFSGTLMKQCTGFKVKIKKRSN